MEHASILMSPRRIRTEIQHTENLQKLYARTRAFDSLHDEYAVSADSSRFLTDLVLKFHSGTSATVTFSLEGSAGSHGTGGRIAPGIRVCVRGDGVAASDRS